jgi:hypothetical protein
MNPIYYIGTATIACGFIFIGWGGEGYLSQVCLILGGLGFGAVVTDALNYVEGGESNE